MGKSSLAWGTALAAHRQGLKVGVVAWSPTGKQAPPPLVREAGLDWIGLETLSTFREYALQIVRIERLYDTFLDNKVLRTFILAAPGLADVVIGGKLADLYQKSAYDLLVVDLPSSGHARSFFKSPLGLQKIFKMGFIARDLETLCALFRDPQTRLDLVTTPEELALVECAELKAELETLHPFSFGNVHLNQCLPEWVRTEKQQPVLLPQQIQNVLSDFNERLDRQDELTPLTKTMKLPVLFTPRFASANWVATIEAVANHLEAI